MNHRIHGPVVVILAAVTASPVQSDVELATGQSSLPSVHRRRSQLHDSSRRVGSPLHGPCPAGLHWAAGRAGGHHAAWWRRNGAGGGDRNRLERTGGSGRVSRRIPGGIGPRPGQKKQLRRQSAFCPGPCGKLNSGHGDRKRQKRVPVTFDESLLARLAEEAIAEAAELDPRRHALAWTEVR